LPAFFFLSVEAWPKHELSGSRFPSPTLDGKHKKPRGFTPRGFGFDDGWRTGLSPAVDSAP
jgi:hypothetical protein